MLGDVAKAEKKFIKLVGGKSKANELLKRLSNAETQQLKGNTMIDYLRYKFNEVQVYCDQLDDLFDSRGIIYLLSTRPHTNSNSNFVKLVKNKVINKSEALKTYLMDPIPNNLTSDVKNIKYSLLRYLKLTNNEQTDEVPEEETEVTGKLKRKNNKNLGDKMQSHRKANRLKIMVSVLIVKMIDNPQMIKKTHINIDNPWGTDKEGFTNNRKESKEEKNKRWDQGKLTIEEFEHLTRVQKSELKYLVIPQGVKEIEFGDFIICEGLKELAIPNSVRIIGWSAFASCTSLERVIIQEGGLTKIGTDAFSNCVKLRSVTIPGSVADIGWFAFRDCSSLATVTIKKGARKQIGIAAFENCKSLKKLVIPPNNIDIVWDRAFLGCPKEMEIEGAGDEDTYIVEAIKKQCAGDSYAEGASYKPPPRTHRPGPPPGKEEVKSHYYDDFVKKFNQMCENKDYKQESIYGLFKIYSDHTSDFIAECKAKPQGERDELGKKLLKYLNKARSVNDYNFLVNTIQFLRNTVVEPEIKDQQLF